MLLELHDIHKHYGPTRANDGVTLAIRPGRIHGILGENGAGKSTLMKVLAGYISRTSGTIRVDGTAVDYHSPDGAGDLGIGMLYQDPLDFPVMTVLDNFMLGQTHGLHRRRDEFARRFDELADELHFYLHHDTPLKQLTVGERQQLEILRLLSLGIKVLILDEPTTGISATQKEVLFAALKKLAASGESVVIVSHKLEDVEALCDEVTVLRDGRVTGGMEKPFDTTAILGMMFGAPPETPPRPVTTPGAEVLRFEEVHVRGGRTGLADCNITIGEGEVVGLAGLEGSGQDVFLRTAGGIMQPERGRIRLAGRVMNGKDYHRYNAAGVTFLPTDRLAEGLIPGLTLTEHFVLKDDAPGFMVREREAEQHALASVEMFNIKGRPHSPVESLSGGNQQRLLLSFLPPEPRLLLLENPTRGLDLESAHWVWQFLHGYIQKQTSLVFSSAELDEIMMAATRVLVFFEGRIIKDVRTEDTDSLELARAIAGKV